MHNILDQKIINYFQANRIKYYSLTRPDEVAIRLIGELYRGEPAPIFEHNYYHIFSYLQYQSRLYAVELIHGRAVLVVKENEIFLFTPSVSSLLLFLDEISPLFKSLNFHQVKILNVSKHWIDKLEQEIAARNGEIIPRSREEVVYNLETLTQLAGKRFAKLRNIRNGLIAASKLIFSKIDVANIAEAFAIVDLWDKVQGFKYEKKKVDKEKYVLSQLSQIAQVDRNLRVEIGRFEGRPLCIVAYFLIPSRPQWGEIYVVKGINRTADGGVHGISDAAYLYVFQELRKLGAAFANDGELGVEPGTREHKMRFLPVEFLQSFDLSLNI